MKMSSKKEQDRKAELVDLRKMLGEEFRMSAQFASNLSEKLFQTKDPNVVLELMARLPYPAGDDDKAATEIVDDIAAAIEVTNQVFGRAPLSENDAVDFAMLVFSVCDFMFPEEE